MPEALRASVGHMFLLGLDGTTEFEFHFSNWLGGSSSHSYPTKPEILKLSGVKLHCFYGSDDRDDLCRTLPSGAVHAIVLSGGHHFGGNYKDIADQIITLARAS